MACGLATRVRTSMTLLASALALVATATERGAAQSGTAGPVGAPDTASQRLDVTLWAGSAHDVRLKTVEDATDLSLITDPTNTHGELGAGLGYERRGRRLTLDAGMDTTGRLDSAAEQPTSLEHRAAAGFDFDVTRRTRISTRASGKYAAVNPLVATPAAPDPGATPIAPSTLEQPSRLRPALTAVAGTIVTHDL